MEQQSLDKNLIKYISKRVVEVADRKRQGAAFAGAWHDGGSNALMDRLKYWKQGLNNEIPADFLEYVDEYSKQKDPEWETYMKLKEKFEKS